LIKYYPKKTAILVAMAKNGLNQRSLSSASGLNASTISNFLNEKHSPSPNSARKIADALDVNIDEIFEIRVYKSFKRRSVKSNAN